MTLSGELGGAERSLLDLMASLRDNVPGTELGLVVGSDGPLGAAVRAMGLRSVLLLPPPRTLLELGDSALKYSGRLRAALRMAARAAPAVPAALRYVGRLRRAIAARRPDVVHSNDNKAHLLTALAASGLAPVVWHLRDFLGSRPLIGRGLARASGRAAGAIAISESVARDARAALPGLPVVVVHNGVDVTSFSPGPGDGRWLDQVGGLPEAAAGTIRVGLVATYARWKGHDLFLRAAAQVLEALPAAPVRFFVVGGAIYRTRGSQVSEPDLRAEAERLGITPHVGFTGFQPDTPAIYRSLDVVVHASTEPEPFGRTIVEAMACGRPVVAARGGGAVELFTEGADALGFPPGDAAALARAIRSLVEAPELRARLAARGRLTATGRFSRDRLGPEVAAAYGRFPSPRSGRRGRRGPERHRGASSIVDESEHRGRVPAAAEPIDHGDGRDVGGRPPQDEQHEH